MPDAVAPSRRRRFGWRGLLVLAGWLAVAAGALGVVARTVRVDRQPAVVVAAFAPWLALLAVVGLGVLVVRRSWPGAVVGLAVVVWTVVVQTPQFVAEPPRHGVDRTVLQANLGVGGADAPSLVAEVRARHVALLTVDELTPAALDHLTAAGLDRLLPHRLTVPFPGGAGTGIWSADPLTNPERIDTFSFELLSATVTSNGAAPLRVVAVHLLPPWPYPSHTWADELLRLPGLLAAPAGGAVVASGDFNATLDQPQFRSLLHGGLHDAAEQAGAGYLPTYPTDRGVPPFLTLDHVLLRGADAARARTVDLPGSDHRGLLVTLRVPEP